MKKTYSIGRLWEPEKDETIWTLDIDFDNKDEFGKEKDGRVNHGAIIIIHGDSPSHCMLKAHYICEVLNSEGMHVAEALTHIMEMAKVGKPLM